MRTYGIVMVIAEGVSETLSSQAIGLGGWVKGG